MIGSVTIVGLGPGSKELISPEVSKAIESATDIIGYEKYTNRIEKRKNLTIHSSDNRHEISRAKLAIDLALQGKQTVIVSSGDPGIFAMSAAFFETLEKTSKNIQNIEIKVLPGISSMLAASSKVGAPLGHDFCVINLSDNLKPWKLIQKRVILAIDSALNIDGKDLLNNEEYDEIIVARDKLKDNLKNENREIIVDSVKNLESISETFVSRRMNSSIKKIMKGKEIKEYK